MPQIGDRNKIDVVMVPQYSIVTCPSILATLPIAFIAGCASWMQLSGVFYLQSTHWALRLADVLLVLCGIGSALSTMFSNPGYSDEIFRNLFIKRNGIRRPELE